MRLARRKETSCGTEYRSVLILTSSPGWPRCGSSARRYRGFEHLEPELFPADTPTAPATVKAGTGLFPGDACGYELTSFGAPFVMLSGTWTVPNLNFSPGPVDPVQFRTFFGLGFLDVHVEMTVDAAQDVTALIRIHTGAQVTLPVRPGDAISAVLYLETDSPGTAFYFLANETTSQTVSFSIDTGFPPAVGINAGISRGTFDFPPGANPLARFGVVYFDDIAAFTTNGTRFLTDGVATTMINEPFGDGSTLAHAAHQVAMSRRFREYSRKDYRTSPVAGLGLSHLGGN